MFSKIAFFVLVAVAVSADSFLFGRSARATNKNADQATTAKPLNSSTDLTAVDAPHSPVALSKGAADDVPGAPQDAEKSGTAGDDISKNGVQVNSTEAGAPKAPSRMNRQAASTTEVNPSENSTQKSTTAKITP